MCLYVCHRSKHRSEGERKLRRLRANHVKSLRQLSGKADRVTSKKHSQNIIHNYTNFSSEVRPTHHTCSHILYVFMSLRSFLHTIQSSHVCVCVPYPIDKEGNGTFPNVGASVPTYNSSTVDPPTYMYNEVSDIASLVSEFPATYVHSFTGVRSNDPYGSVPGRWE